ncbi:MAG: ABC transporter permease subunit [Planctomycetes bacterium]|nr:ABC transporter permease subunit [Planctomycetota bacterium]
MGAFVSAAWLLFHTHLRRLAWSKRALVCALLALLAPLAAFLVASLGRRVGPADVAVHVGFLLQLQVILPVLALVAGSAAVAEEVEDRTITFLFSRPVPRPAVLIGRWSAILVFLLTLLAASTLLLLAASARAKGHGDAVDAGIREPLLVAVLLGGAVYSALFAVLGVFVKNPIIVGLGYAFAFEGFLANLPASTQALTIQFYLRSVVAALGSPAWNRVEGFASPSFDPLPKALWTLGLVLALALALGAWRIARREFVVSA